MGKGFFEGFSSYGIQRSVYVLFYQEKGRFIHYCRKDIVPCMHRKKCLLRFCVVSVSLCMIVKNEEKVIACCLDSVKNLVDEIIILGTIIFIG